MKSSFKFIALLSIVFILIFSCKKDNDDDPKPTPTKTQMLIGSWKMNSWTVNPPIIQLDSNFDTIYVSDMYADYQDCSKDDLLVFKSHNIYLVEEGDSTCSPDGPQVIVSGNWTLSSDEKHIVITNSWGTSSNEIKSLSSSLLELTYTQYDWWDSTLYVHVQQYAKQ